MLDLQEILLGKRLIVALPSVVLPSVHHTGLTLGSLVAVDSLGVPVVAGGHLVQVGQTFPLEELSQNPSWPLVEEIQERAAAVLVEKGVDVPLLLVVMFETVVVLLSWKETAVSAWAFGHILQCSWHSFDWSAVELEAGLVPYYEKHFEEAVHKETWKELKQQEEGNCGDGPHFAEC